MFFSKEENECDTNVSIRKSRAQKGKRGNNNEVKKSPGALCASAIQLGTDDDDDAERDLIMAFRGKFISSEMSCKETPRYPPRPSFSMKHKEVLRYLPSYFSFVSVTTDEDSGLGEIILLPLGNQNAGCATCVNKKCIH